MSDNPATLKALGWISPSSKSFVEKANAYAEGGFSKDEIAELRSDFKEQIPLLAKYALGPWLADKYPQLSAALRDRMSRYDSFDE